MEEWAAGRFLEFMHRLPLGNEDEAASIDLTEDLDTALDEIIDAGEKRQVPEKLGL